MQIDRILEYALTAEMEAEIAALLARCFDTDFGGRSYFQQRHHIRFTARQGAALLGHMALCYRDVRLGNDLIPIWGLAEVATDPDARGQGIASRLLAEAIAFAKTTPAQFFVLFGDRALYGAAGFRNTENSVTYLTLEGARMGQVYEGSQNHLMVLPLADTQWDGSAKLDFLGHKF